MAENCSLKINIFVKRDFYSALGSKDLSKVKETLLNLLKKYDINDIIGMIKTIPPMMKKVDKIGEDIYNFINDVKRIQEFLSSPKTISTPEIQTVLSKEIEIDNPDQIVQTGKRSKIWLSEAWGIASLAKNKFVADTFREINTRILRSITQIQRDEDPAIVLNAAIQNYFISNLNYLKEFFETEGKPDYAKIIEDNMPFEGDSPNTRINNIIRGISEYFESYPNLEKMAYSDRNNKNYKKALAFARFLLIQPLNFDNFIKANFNSILVKNLGKLTGDMSKYYFTLGKGRQNATWQDEDAVYKITRMVDSIVQSEISSWPIYRKFDGIWTLQLDEYCDTNKVVGTISKLLNIADLKGDPNNVLFTPIINNSQNEELLSDMFKIFGNAFGYNLQTNERVIDLVFKKYIEGKNIPQIMKSIPLDAQHLLPVAIYLLTKDIGLGSKKTSILELLKKELNDIVKIDDNELNIIQSVWRSMYDPMNNDSLFNRANSDNTFDVYLMISLVFGTHERKNLYGIMNDMGTIVKKYYSIGKANQRLNYFQSKINGFYSPLINRNLYNTEITNDFDTDSPITTIKFKVPYKSNVYTIKIGKDINPTITKNGKSISDLEAKYALDDLKLFFENTIKLDFTSNRSNLIDIYKNLTGGSNSKTLNYLVRISANLIYANEISKSLQNESVSDFKNNLRKFYHDTPKLVRGVTYNQIDAFSGKTFALLSKLSIANDIHDGIMGDIVVKGGAGELINSVILSTLTTKFSQFIQEKSEDPNSAIKHFSIQDAYKRMTFLRDYVDKTGDVKSSTSMNVEEFFINNFIYDFYGDSLAIHLGVLSDKPNVPKMELYLDTPILIEGDKIKKLKDCTASDLRKVAVRELGLYYSKMKLEMERNLRILSNYSPKGILYDINTDYLETRGISKKELEQDIHEAIYLAQLEGEDIEINELLYFSWDGENLHTKPSLIAELAKHDVEVNTLGLNVENSEQFFNRKESELVTNILLDLRKGISFIDSLSLKVLDSPAVKALLKANRYVVNGSTVYGDKNSWTTRSNVIVGKILYGDKFKDLVTKKSLTNWGVYKNLWTYLNEVGDNRFDISKLDINGDFDMQYFLATLSLLYPTILEYAFTLKKLSELKSKLKEKLNSSEGKINKKVLIEDYKRWRKENYPEESEIEFNQAVLNYETESDERKWKMRDTSFKMAGINDINTLEEIEALNKKHKLGIDTKFEREEAPKFILKVNPELLRYNTLHYLYSEEGMNSLVGSHINHKAKYNRNLSLLGAIETGLQAKRNVSLSGAKNLYVRGDIRGVGATMRIASVQDVKAGIFTVNGVEDSKAATPMDGSTIGNYVTRKEELYSLGSQKAGIDNSKPLGNDLNSRTGTGTIIKTAVFVLTNGRIRSSSRNIIMHKHMNNIPWEMLNGDLQFDGNFLVDFNGKNIKYHPVIVFKPSVGKYYMRFGFNINSDGTTSFLEVEINNNVLSVPLDDKLTIGSIIRSNLDITPYLSTILAITGSQIENLVTSRPIRTNYELWDLFGGAYSAAINDNNTLTYENDNTSLENLTIAAHSVGRRINEGVTRPTNEDVWLPLKEAKIDWIVTEGAIKLGAANVNSTRMFDDENYHVTTQIISTADIGMLLNPEHLVDKSHVTLMTLVVNALPLRGFSSDVARRCYLALAYLTDSSLSDLFKGIEVGDNSLEFKDAVSSLLLKSILGTSETDGDLLASIVIQLNKLEKNGHDYDIIKHKLPISDPAVLNKLVSNFSSIMTKAGIRISFPGSMNVLVPSDGIYKIYGGKLRYFASTSRTNGLILNSNSENLNSLESLAELLRLLELQALLPPKKLHEITLGASYFITLNEGEFDSFNPLTVDIIAGKSIKIDDLSTYYSLKDMLKGKNYTLVEDVITGRDLAPYNCVFNTDKGLFMLWDMDSIRHIHMAENNPQEVINILRNNTSEEIQSEFHINPNTLDFTDDETLLNSFKKLINIRKQIELNSIGSGNDNDVYINGEKVIIDKSSLLVSPYELIAPKNYATTFGLRIGDDLSEIAQDLYWFLKRFLNNYNNVPVDSDCYDVILKTISGKHYPILFNSGSTKIPKGLERITDLEFYSYLDWEGNKVYRLDADGNRLYEIPYHTDSKNRIVYDVEILVDRLGNEVIFTKNIKSFINKLSFNNIDFGRHILEVPSVLSIIDEFNGSKKALILKFYDEYTSLLLSSDKVTDKSALLDIRNANEILIKNQINEWLNIRDLVLSQLLEELKSGEVSSTYTGIFGLIINSAIETHTSFIKSLDYIVSRTPAQSHQSFMPMKLVAFDESGVNSAYVSRWQLYLLGSDYDVDKASLLGSIFRNGKYVKWSPFMNLSSKEHLRASEKLPFPNGKRLQEIDLSKGEQLTLRIYDVMDKPINLVWNDNEVIFKLPESQLEVVLEKINSGQFVLHLTNAQLGSLSPMEQYVLERAIVDKLNEGDLLISEIDFTGLGIENGIKDSSKIDYLVDFLQFNDIFRESVNNLDTVEGINDFATLLNAYNNFGFTIIGETMAESDSKMIRDIAKKVNRHNLYFERNASDPKDAIVNYISSIMFLISSDPTNLVQAMTSVDQQTEVVKSLANKLPLAKQSLHFDKGNIMSTFRLLRLTLSGKQNTGIEASALKVMEAINLYQDVILNYGDDAEQKGLITLLNIGGYNIGMICNAYAKNIANIKSKEVYDALLEIDNSEDLALWLSSFLSLSTDNAKDPTLAKINANPEMIGLYNAGFVLGLPIDFLVKTIMSQTGMALAEVLQGNVFLGVNSLRNIGNVIQYVEKGPLLNLNPTTLKILTKAIEALFGESEEGINAYNIIKKLIPRYYNRLDLLLARRIIGLAKSLAYNTPNEEIEYNLPSVKNRVKKELSLKSRLLRGIQSAIEAQKQLISEAEQAGAATKRLNTKLDKLTEQLSELETEVEQLRDIKNEVEVSQSIPNKIGSKYSEYREYEEQLQSLSKGEESGIISTLSSFKEFIKESSNFKKAISDIEAYLDTCERIQMDLGFEGQDGNHYHSMKIIKLLNLMANEMSLIRPLLGLNQLLPNSKENLLSFILKFQNIIEDRLAESDLKETQELEALLQLNELLGKPKNAVSLIDFIWDENYRLAAIKAYESIKFKVNVLDVIVKVEHYFGYLKTCGALYKSLLNVSLLYRELDRIAEVVLRGDLKVKSTKEIEKRLKSASRYISRRMNNLFLSQLDVELTIPKIKDGIVDTSIMFPIKLGTIEGNIAFKLWMDLVVIPKYKQAYSTNRFFKELSEATYHKSDNHNTIINFTTGIDIMSNNPTEVTKVAEVTEAFNRLQTQSINGLPLVDAFFYYDLISYDRQPGQQALTPIFNQLLALGNTKVISDYVQFVSDLDLGGNYIITMDDQTIDEIERFIAPVVSIYALDETKEKYCWVKDPEDLKFYLLEKVEKNERGDYDNEMYDIEEQQQLENEFFGEDFRGNIDGIENEESFTLTLSSKLLDLEGKYRIISENGNISNPYMEEFTVTDDLLILDGQALINPKSLTIGKDSAYIKGNELIITDAFKKKLRDITGLKNVDDLIVTKTMIDGNSPQLIIDIDATKGNLENPCK